MKVPNIAADSEVVVESDEEPAPGIPPKVVVVRVQYVGQVNSAWVLMSPSPIVPYG